MSEIEAAYVLRYGPVELVDGTARTRASRIESVWCHWHHQRFDARSSHGALCKLARVLIAAGAPDGLWQSVTIEGKPSLSGPSLSGLAKLTIEEGEKPPRFRRYKERPHETIPDLVGGNGKEADAGVGGHQDTGAAAKPAGMAGGRGESGMVSAEAQSWADAAERADTHRSVERLAEVMAAARAHDDE